MDGVDPAPPITGATETIGLDASPRFLDRGDDPCAVQHFDAAELADLERALDAVAASEDGGPAVTVSLGQLVARA